MITHGLTRLANHAGILSTPVELFRRLLAPWADYCAERGLVVDALVDQDEAAIALWRFFSQPDPAMPGGLREALLQVASMADERGFDRLLARLEGTGHATDWTGLGLSPLHISLKTWLEHRRSFEEAVGRRSWGEVTTAREYVGPAGRADVELDAARCDELARSIGTWFERQGRSRFCRLVHCDDGDAIHFAVRRGLLRKTEAAIADPDRDTSVDYRPQQEDLVTYDRGTGRLVVKARGHRAQEEYRRLFGQLLFDDRRAFRGAEVVSLEPLRDRGLESLIPVPGIRDVALTELWLRSRHGVGLDQRLISRDVFAALTENRVELGSRTLAFAKLRVHYATGRPRKVELRPPDRLGFDRDRHARVTLDFLRARGFVAASASERTAPPPSPRGQLRWAW